MAIRRSVHGRIRAWRGSLMGSYSVISHSACVPTVHRGYAGAMYIGLGALIIIIILVILLL